jgi:hypothetical protein
VPGNGDRPFLNSKPMTVEISNAPLRGLIFQLHQAACFLQVCLIHVTCLDMAERVSIEGRLLNSRALQESRDQERRKGP